MLKKIYEKFRYKHKASSESYIQYLKKIGVKIGEDVDIYSPRNTVIDEQYPWMITIGNHVRITEGVVILTHDYSWSVLKNIKINENSGKILGASGTVEIGNNVFIGMNSLILRNVKIGDNVIIGGGSVVSKNCDSNWVYAGNPAKKIMTLEEFYSKREEKQFEEAKKLALEYHKSFGKMPPKSIFHEYFMLFTTADNICKEFDEKMHLCGSYEDSLNLIKNNDPMFKNFEEFLECCFGDVNEEYKKED